LQPLYPIGAKGFTKRVVAPLHSAFFLTGHLHIFAYLISFSFKLTLFWQLSYMQNFTIPFISMSISFFSKIAIFSGKT